MMLAAAIHFENVCAQPILSAFAARLSESATNLFFAKGSKLFDSPLYVCCLGDSLCLPHRTMGMLVPRSYSMQSLTAEVSRSRSLQGDFHDGVVRVDRLADRCFLLCRADEWAEVIK